MAAWTVQATIVAIPADPQGASRHGPLLSSTQWLVWGLARAGKFF
jgi:hypothetical protein